MAYSLYETNGYGDMAKPSDLMDENDYTQDTFYQTRPEVFDFDHRDKGEGVDDANPFYRFYPEDESVRDKELSDQHYNHKPQNWEGQDPYTVDTRFKNRNKNRKSCLDNVISEYRMSHHEPVVMSLYLRGNKHGERTAATLETLMRQVFKFPQVKQKATKTTVRLVRADEKNLSWQYRVKGHEEYSDSAGHLVTVKIERDPKEKDMRKMQVKIVCTCPFWKYKGPDYNANRFNYLEGPQMSNGQAPVVNPTKAKKTLICKHVYAVGLLFQKFAAKYNLDTFKEVDEIYKLLKDEKQLLLPDIGMESIEEISKMLEKSDMKKLNPLIGKYHREKDEERQKKIHEDAVKELGEILEYKDKTFLQKVLKNVKDYTKKIFNKFKRKNSRKASLDSVLEMYINQRYNNEIRR